MSKTFPKPDFNRPNYTAPSIYIGVDPIIAGHSARVDEVIQSFSALNQEERLKEIWQWINSNLTCENDPNQYFWRSVDDIIDRKKYVGCADHALMFGTLARASGIPTIWVKSLDIDWIKKFRKDGSFNGGKGHVFLEVYLNSKWMLLDAQAGLLYEPYNSGGRLFPENRFAYDKGGNPRQLILSIDWEPWVRQTKSYFSSFDVNELEEQVTAVLSSPRRFAV